MEAGEVVEVKVDDVTFNVVLEDRVLPDRSAGQYEAGWWVWDQRLSDQLPDIEDQDSFFLSEVGILYGFVDTPIGSEWTKPVGEAPLLVKRAAEMNDDY